MPCALPYATEMPHSSHPWVISQLRVKRVVSMNSQYVPIPVGYLPAILVFLLTMFSGRFFLNDASCNIEMWSSCDTSLEECLFGGAPPSTGGTLFLLWPTSQECEIIRNHVLESIRLTEEKLHIREGAITKVDSFLCSCGKGRAHHICAYNPETHIVECEVTRECCVCIGTSASALARCVTTTKIVVSADTCDIVLM